MSSRKLIAFAFFIGCGYFTQAQQAQLRASLFEQAADIQVDIYPNPATEYITVDLSESQSRNVEFELRSMIGTIIRIEPENIGYNKYRIPLKDYATGYYFLIVKDEHIRFKKAFKFLKK